MNIYYQVHRLKCNRREKKGFICNRPNGTDDYLLLHFKVLTFLYKCVIMAKEFAERTIWIIVFK